MKRWRNGFLLLLFLALPAWTQIEIILDNDTPAFTTAGTWIEKYSAEAINGQARYKARGTGVNYAMWRTPVTWPGLYTLEMNIIQGNYADSVFCTIRTAHGDTTVIVAQRYLKGWQLLGAFDLADSCSIKITDKAAGKGSMVLADAIRLTANLTTYPLSGRITFSDGNDRIYSRLALYRADGGSPLASWNIAPNTGDFVAPGVIDGWYRLVCTAYGYETAALDSIRVQGQGVTGLALSMQPTPGSRYKIEGAVLFHDADPNRIAHVRLFVPADPLPIGFDSLRHGGTWSLPNLIPGTYRLIFTAPNCLPDSTTFASVVLGESDQQLAALTLYPFFRFAWITDSHIGAGTDAAIQMIFRRVTLMQEDLDFLIHTGDITEKGLENEFSLYKDYALLCKIPVHSIPGNHDTKWSPSGLQAWTKLLGPRHFSFTHKGFKFIGFNNGIPMRGGCGYFDPADIAWLKDELARLESPAMPIIFAAHLPLDEGGTPNFWQVADLLKSYRTIWVMVGHGHTNRAYDFEGIPGAMGRDTYSTKAGFNIVSLSEKEISVQTCTAENGEIAPVWYKTATLQKGQPIIRFTNLQDHETISGAKTVDIQVSEPVSGGLWEVNNTTLGLRNLGGSGTTWSCELPATGIENGHHTLKVRFATAAGNAIAATIAFYVENDYPRALWKYDSGAQILTQPAADADGVYAGSSDGRIIGLSRTTGMPLWPAVQTGGGLFSSPLAYQGMVYAGSADGLLYAIDARSGATKWTFRADGAVLTAPVVQDTLLFFAGGSTFYALGLSGGGAVWKYVDCGTVECKPFIANDKIIFGSWDGKVRALESSTGKLAWSWSRQSNFYYAPAACWPVASGDKAFVTDPERYLSAIDLSSGKTIWSANSPEFWESIGISTDRSRVYGRSLDGQLYAFAAAGASQTLLWKASVDYGWDSIPSMPIEMDGVVYSSGKKGFVVANDGATGGIYWKYWIGPSHVTTVTPLDRSHVVAASLDGVVLLIEGDPSTRVHEGTPALLPETTRLYPPYPNPFNGVVAISYALASRQPVSIAIYNMLGEEIYTAPAQILAAGEHHFAWEGVDRFGKTAPSGIYYVRLSGASFVKTAKLVMVK